MNSGAEQAAPARGDELWLGSYQKDEPRVEQPFEHSYESEAAFEPETGNRRGRATLAGLLILLATGWIALSGVILYQSWESAQGLARVASWLATVCVPLALLALVWLIFGRTSRAESERFTRAVGAMRAESEALERVLTLVAERIGINREQLSAEATRLMQLGEEASDRLGRVTHHLVRESEGLNARAQAIEAAAAQARTDLGVLMADLPQAEQAARGFSDTVREAGMTAHERAAALEAQLSAITARAQDADAATGGAAERLSAHIARIESSAGVASQQLEGAAARLDAAVDAALGRTSDAVDATRTALEAQSQALFASVEQGRARFAEAGIEIGGEVERHLSEAQRTVETISAGIAAQEQASGALVARLTAQIAGLDERLTTLSQRAEGQSSQMATALADLRDATATLRQEVDASTQEAAALVGRAGEMAGALDATAERLRGELPVVLADIESRAEAMRNTALSAIEPVESLQAAAADGAARLTASGTSIVAQREAIDAIIAGLNDGIATIGQRLGELTALSSEADHSIGAIVRDTGPELVETLVRVRDAARAAAAHARDTITAVIPQSAAALSDAAGVALGETITASVQQQIAELEASSQRAAASARAASERLTRQMLALGQSAAALEDKIAEEKAAREDQVRDAMPRRVALLIESLNSTAIDVTKILSNDISDSAWQSYLKGDRGVFTRRAVRLLESGEAREIQRHYDQEPEFRSQVNRYIGDFEAMLRRFLSDGDGNVIAVTLLSSDMGKLYVALAQAIQHLRV